MAEASRGAKILWESSYLTGDFIFYPEEVIATAVSAVHAPLAAAQQAIAAVPVVAPAPAPSLAPSPELEPARMPPLLLL
ncbi:MAG: hypothetical protein ACI9JM_000512 [Halioglobus sp.]